MTQLSDEELVQRARAGCADAVGHLYERYGARVYYIALAILGCHAEAEDVRQEVFAKIQQSLRTFNPDEGHFKTWLGEVATNACRDVLRKQRSWGGVLDRLKHAVWEKPHDHKGPMELAILNEELRELWAAVAQLPQQQRLVIALPYGLKLSSKEIAEWLGISHKTVDVHHKKAVERLQQRLDRDNRLF